MCSVRRIPRQTVQSILRIPDSVSAAVAALQESVARGRRVIMNRSLRANVLLKEETAEGGQTRDHDCYK